MDMRSTTLLGDVGVLYRDGVRARCLTTNCWNGLTGRTAIEIMQRPRSLLRCLSNDTDRWSGTCAEAVCAILTIPTTPSRRRFWSWFRSAFTAGRKKVARPLAVWRRLSGGPEGGLRKSAAVQRRTCGG